MIEKIISLSVRNKLGIVLLMLALIGGGLFAFQGLPIDAVPDITNNQVQVVTVAPSASPQEVERFITFPLELSLGNLPGVESVRSISRYGLSVITVIFDDDIPFTQSRLLVSESINKAAADIPNGFGTPELMPITTGLGEIYQYTLQVDSAFREHYTATELRTIQDWIIKRRLTGIPGIVETSSFGGFLKEYEVAIDPVRMNALGVTADELSSALETSNRNEGGSYVEKGDRAWYIRAQGLLTSISDIENVVVHNESGIPVRVRDVATVHEGHAKRFGALTQDGLGEAVGGITLMLKGANSSQTIEKVKARVAEIQKSLPPGIHIAPFLDRAKLVEKNMSTVAKNLIEGGIIVLLVLLLMLGNWRAGVVVASVIPLALLFAFICMRIFNVSANLMSLGAIDFGIVVDGAVVIVEAVLHTLFATKAGQKLTQEELNQTVIKSTTGIYRSAAFGVLIIIVVFIPILTLTGIEGKMFKPMAMTVSFAVLGALLLSLTYVPMMSSLLLPKNIDEKPNFAERLLHRMQMKYKPILESAIKHARLTISIAALLFVSAGFLFYTMGGEFIPTLEEGDLAMQMAIPPGASLNKVVETSTRAEQILMKKFPEVKHVVSKIGTGEVPTDPMAVEDADIMIILKDKSEWVSAESREELADKMKQALAEIPGVSFEFTQPIQLRFNELMTGSKADVAVKIYGEDNDELARLAAKCEEIIKKVQGAGDVKVERTSGLPQQIITYRRDRLAEYGVKVDDLNALVRTAFSGAYVGNLYEGEKRFSLVVRLDSARRERFDIEGLMVPAAGGRTIPLTQLADITENQGPILITRENTRRRIAIGVNVRGRDVESLVKDIQSRLEKSVKLPSGYFFDYGGQFENLQAAKARLSIAVPVALVLILVFLYLAFGEIRPALLVFVAVPLSAIGGIIALQLRSMPFSISAGVGFIALFGVAVLNGIVLISSIRSYIENGVETGRAILEASLSRLRPVLMTAMVASLGFLPMALSTSAGAEVQKPLATVVIGGLVSSTLLTLLVLPVIMSLQKKKDHA